MWFVIMWIGIGVVGGIAGLFGGAWALDTVDSARHRKREAVRQEYRDAEKRVQQITQDALQRMLDLARSRL